MRKLIVFLTTALAAAFMAAPAPAHLAYCGHTDEVYRVDGVLHKADYRYYGNSGGDHRHYYKHWVWAGGAWRFQHDYSRLCNGVV